MKSRLTAQDRVIAGLTGYVNVQVADRLARAIHDTYGAVHEVVARGQVQDSGFVAALGHSQESAAASEFHVVGMGGYGQDIEIHFCSSSRE